MKMAKPSQARWDAAGDLIGGLACLIEHGEHPETGDKMTLEERWNWLEHKWQGGGWHTQHCLEAGQTAINNTCDPDADVLEFRSEIRTAFGLLAAFAECPFSIDGKGCTHPLVGVECPHERVKVLLKKAESAGIVERVKA